MLKRTSKKVEILNETRQGQKDKTNELKVDLMATISEETDSSDEDDDLKDTTVAIQYVTHMFNKL